MRLFPGDSGGNLWCSEQDSMRHQMNCSTYRPDDISEADDRRDKEDDWCFRPHPRARPTTHPITAGLIAGVTAAATAAAALWWMAPPTPTSSASLAQAAAAAALGGTAAATLLRHV